MPDRDDFVKAGPLAGHGQLGRYAGKPEGQNKARAQFAKGKEKT